jgi:hypothetical protein
VAERLAPVRPLLGQTGKGLALNLAYFSGLQESIAYPPEKRFHQGIKAFHPIIGTTSRRYGRQQKI